MLSKRLKKERLAKKLTQQDLAEKINTTKGTISNYENGHSTPSNEILKELADILDVTSDYLLGRTDSPNNEQKDELHDPSVSVFYKEFNNSSPEKREELLKIWEIIKERDKDR